MMELLHIDFAQPVEGVEAFSTTRGEVDRRNTYSGVNLCDYVGDDALLVLDARLTLAMQLGVDLDDLVIPRQTHSCRVAVIDERFRALDIDKDSASRTQCQIYLSIVEAPPIFDRRSKVAFYPHFIGHNRGKSAIFAP